MLSFDPHLAKVPLDQLDPSASLKGTQEASKHTPSMLGSLEFPENPGLPFKPFPFPSIAIPLF